jgi:hypothetical protein
LCSASLTALVDCICAAQIERQPMTVECIPRSKMRGESLLFDLNG